MLIAAIAEIHAFALNISLWASGIIITLGVLIRIVRYFDRTALPW